jgi:hypothetical protein
MPSGLYTRFVSPTAYDLLSLLNNPVETGLYENRI